jgi:hypothetical protein
MGYVYYKSLINGVFLRWDEEGRDYQAISSTPHTLSILNLSGTSSDKVIQNTVQALKRDPGAFEAIDATVFFDEVQAVITEAQSVFTES